ncbi:hypothetical protein Gogos_002943, partial [Gossypium gossypioides]|nr:hypothetical protein [Gossypium gossypioides]
WLSWTDDDARNNVRLTRAAKGCPRVTIELIEHRNSWLLVRHGILACGECKKTLEDVALQLDLPMDGPVVTGSTIVPSKEDICETFLEKVPNKFQGGRIDMKRLETNFIYLPSNVSDVVKEKYA